MIELTTARNATVRPPRTGSLTACVPSSASASTASGGTETVNWMAADHHGSGAWPIQRCPSVPRLRVTAPKTPSATAAGPPAPSMSGPSTISTPATPIASPTTWRGDSRSPSSTAASTAVSTGVRACRREARVAGRPASKARYIAPNWTAFIASPVSAIRPRSARSMRSGPRSTRATTRAITAATAKRSASRVNGATCCTP